MPSPRVPRGSVAPRFAQRAIALAILVLLALTRGSAQTGQLTVVTPAGASSQVSINITGTGFNTTAANNEVSFVAAGGATVTASATAIATVDASRDLRRITVRVPSGLPTGTAALQVRNTATGLISAGRSLEVIALSLPDVTSASPGTSNLDVRITGSPNTSFVAGKTQISFGTGITINSVAVKSATELVANITVPANVAPGARNLQMSSAQLAILPGAFTIAAAPPPNSNPTITSSPITVANEGQPYIYDVNATDPDAGDTVAYALVQPPSGMTIDPVSGVITWMPGAGDVPAVQVRVQARDGRGGSAEQSFIIGVAAAPPPNSNPTITSSPITVANEGQPYTYDVNATDPDAGDTVAFALVQPPAGMAIDPVSGVISWTPGAGHVPTVAVRVQATDGRGGSAEQLFNVSVAAANKAPQITSSPVTTAREQLVYSYQVVATDPNNDALTFVLKSGPAGMTMDALGMIVWTPPANPPATAPVVVVVSDPALLSDTQAFEIAVTAAPRVNQSPQIVSSPNLAAQATTPYTYDVNATDADAGDTLTYSLIQPPAGMSINSGTGVIAWTPTAEQTGPIAITVRVSDGTDTAQQAFELNVAAAENTNRAPAAHVGGPYNGEAGAAIAFDGKASTDPDGDPLVFSWDFGDGSQPGSGDSPTHAYQNSGAFTVTLTVTDGRGGQNSRATSVAVGAAGDRAPPSVTLTGPREVLPGEQVTVTAVATDNVKVDKVRFEVDGANPSDAITQPFLRSIAVPSVASPGTEIKVKATATDPSGNAGSAETTLTITARPDTEKPVVLLNAPPLAAPGAIFRVSATAKDNAGVQSVAFSLNGGTAQTSNTPPYEATFTVPEDAPVGAALNIRAVAVDFSNNTADADAIVSVVATPDTQPPTVQLSARATALAGSTLDLGATAADNRGIVAVDFYVDGVKVATDADAPYAAAYVIPSTTPAGRTLQLEARAIDFADLEGTDSRQTTIIAVTNVTAGALSGEVYNDTTGLPLEGVTIRLVGADLAGAAYTQQTITDARGRYLINAVEGSGVLEVRRTGWSSVDRPVDVLANKSTEVMDARLTPLTPNPAIVNPVSGANVTTPRGTLIIPPGVLTAPAPMTMTAIGQQGLQSLLPAGWTPVAIADVTPHDAGFSSAATLTISNIENVPAAATLTLAVWDEEERRWRAVGSAARGSGALSHAIEHPGQFAWLIADTAPAAPHPPDPGEFLAGVVAARVPADATSIVSPQSKVVFYQPGVSIEVTGLATLATRVPSGTVVLTRIAESYQFTNGDEAHIEPYSQDIVLYQPIGASAAALNARYQVTPSLTFEAATLKSGVITVELFDPPLGPRLADLISGNGGSVTAETGERADVPANAMSSPVPLQVQALGEDDLGIDIPDALAFVGGVQLSAAGAQFNESLTLSISKPGDLPADAQVLIARLTDLGNTSRLVLVAVGRLVNDRIESSTLIGGAPSALEGIRSTGRYVFLRPTSPVGFATGLVRGVSGTEFAGALVSSNTLPLFALSGAAGQYVSAAREGAASLLAVDTQRNDAGSAQGVIATNAAVAINLQLTAQPPLVTSVTPANQATNVPLSNPIVITFSEPLNPSTVTASSIVLTQAGGNPIAGTLSLSNNNSVVTLRPTDPLPGDAPFTVTVTTVLADLAGYTLPQAFTSQFTSLDITAPPPPPAGAISATIPGPNGTTTVRGTQGTAGLHDTVTIVNKTNGAITPVLLEPNGGFTVLVTASRTDRLEIKIVDAAGNTTVIPIAQFTQTNADGSLSAAIGKEGGHIDGPGGTAVDVPAGAFPNGAIVTVKPVSEAEFPVQLPAAAGELVSYAGGIEVDFGGETPAVYVNVSVPAGPNDLVTDQWMVSLATEVNGQQMMQMVDTAKLINGRIQTSSPPCPGVTGRGVYGVHKFKRAAGLNYGLMYSTGYGGITARLEFPFLGSLSGILPILVLGYEFPTPMCLPAMTGRMTVSANSQQVSIPASELHGDDREIVVRNTTLNREYHFPRNVLEYSFRIDGSINDNFEVRLKDAFGAETLATGVDVKAAPPNQVRVTVDADSISTSVAEVIIRNLTTGTVSQFFMSLASTVVSVGGGAGDSFLVSATTASGVSRSVSGFTVIPSPLGGGNLVVHGVAGSIDPTKAQIDAYNASHPNDPPVLGDGVFKVEFINETTGAVIPIPLNTVVDGAFQMAFSGNESHQFAVRQYYEGIVPGSVSKTEYTRISNFRIVVSNPRTGRVIKTIETQAPPKDEPLNLGIITDDFQAPILTSGPARLNSFDPSGLLTFTFSEPMNADSLKNGIIVERVDQNGQRTRVAGTVRVSSGNRVATFVPVSPLRVASEYSVTFVGSDSLGGILAPGVGAITDPGGNSLGTQRFRIKTFAPKLTGPAFQSFAFDGQPLPLKDVAILQRRINNEPKTHLAITAGTIVSGQSYRLLSLDVTDPNVTPVNLGTENAGSGKQRIEVVRGLGSPGGPSPLKLRETATWCNGAGTSFTGDLAVTSSFNQYYSYFSFFDVSQPVPCLIANKLLTATPDLLSSYSQRGTVHAQGFARGIATVKSLDPVTGQDRLAAYAAVGEVGLFAADVGNNIPEYDAQHRVKEGLYAGDYWDVVNVDDRLLAANYGDQKLELFDPNLALLGSVDLPDQPRRVITIKGYGFDADEDGLITPAETLDLAIVACQSSIQIVDITNTDQMAVIGSIDMPGIVRDLDIDPEKHRLFVGGEIASTVGTQAFYMIDLANPRQSGLLDDDGDGKDDRIVWTKPYPEGLGGFKIDRARGLAYIPTGKGLEVWAIYDLCCDLGVDLTAQRKERPGGGRAALLQKEKEALQKGIADGLAKAQTDCGLPAAGFSILEQGSGACLWKANPEAACSDNYQPGLSDHDFELFVPDAVYNTAGVCAAKALTAQFKDPVTGEPKPISLTGGSSMTFEDITFFAEVKERFESAVFDVEPPPASGGSDEVGDMGLGRRQLLFKWLLEGEYIQLPGQNVAGRDLSSILATLKSATGIPRLEGYEWAYLQAFNLAKAKAFLRIKGASKPESSLYSFYIKQLHDAGKAGIRATLGRMVADSAANPRVLNVTRDSYARDACLGIDPLITSPNSWPVKPCTSFEEYVASAAARTLRYPSPLSLFTRDEVVNKIARFAYVKSDRERITSEVKADEFIAMAATFIEDAKVKTADAYNNTLPLDPDKAQRQLNLASAIKYTATAMSAAKLALKPHIFNHGFRPGSDLELAMWETDNAGSGTKRTSVRTNLAGGEDQYFSLKRNPDGTLFLDPVTNKPVPLFQIEVDMSTGFSTGHGITFTIDLDERKLKEANRDNNYGGFWYYVLDRAVPVQPVVPARSPLPFPSSVLDPNTECDDSPLLSINQQLIIDGQALDGDLDLGMGETATIRLTVINLASEPQQSVLACSNITNQCYDAGTLAVGEIKVLNIPFTAPLEGRYFPGTPTASSPDAGIVTGAALNVMVGCEAYAIVAIDSDPKFNPNPETSEVMIGGKTYRYYKVVNKRTGAPKVNATVTLELKGGTTTQTFTFTTNDRGIISASSSGEPGIAIDSTSLSTSFIYFAKVTGVNGVPMTCALPTEYTINVTDREYSESYMRGTAISGSIGIPIIGAEGSAEAGMTLKRNRKFLTGIQSIEVSSAFETQGKVGADFALFEFKAGIGVGELKASAEVGISGAKSTSKGATYSFPYPLTQNSNCALANLTLSGMLHVNPLIPKLLDLVRAQPCSDMTQYLTATSSEFGRTAANTGKVELSATRPLPKTEKNIGVKFGGSAGGGFGVKTSYETGYTFNGALATTSVKEGYTLNGGIDFSFGFDVSQSDPPDPDDDEKQTQLEEATATKFKQAAGVSGSSSSVETYKVEFEYNLASLPLDGKPTAINITYTGPKTWGWKKDLFGLESKVTSPAPASTITYRAEDPDTITEMVTTLANMKAIRDTNVLGQLAFLELQLVPTVLNEEYSKFRALLRKKNVSYSVDGSNGDAFEIPFGLKGKLFGFKLGAGFSIKSDEKIDYAKERGVVIKGVMYPLTKYTDDAFIPNPTFGLWETVETVWDALLASFASSFSDKNAPVAPNQPNARMKSDHTATIEINSAAEPEPFEAGLFSYQYRSIAGPVKEARVLPSDTAGPAGKPHYGIGSFHHLTPGDRQLAAPASLVIDYKDEELDGVDESSLAIFGWNSTTKDWDLVGGTLDMAANTVSTTINTLRLYTLGPRRMPARDIALTYEDLGTSGEQANMVQRFRVTAGALQTNTGEAVPDGTLYTVKSVIGGTSDPFDYGTITAADADPAREGIQLPVSGGTFSFVVEYPAPFGFYSAGKAVVFSTTGTAFGQQVLTVVTP